MDINVGTWTLDWSIKVAMKHSSEGKVGEVERISSLTDKLGKSIESLVGVVGGVKISTLGLWGGLVAQSKASVVFLAKWAIIQTTS